MPGYQSYRQQQIEGAGPMGLVLLMYEALVQSLVRARKAIESEDYELRYEQSIRAMRALLELLDAIDYEKGGDLAGYLASMYIYMHDRLLEAQTGDLMNAIDEVLDLTQTLREGWQEVADMEEKKGNIASDPATHAVVG